MKITIDNILNEAKTEEQKKKALAKIQKEIKKNWLSALIYGLVYFVNTFFLLSACFTLLFDEEDKAELENLPGIIAQMLDACNKWILSIPEWAVFNKINEWVLSVSKGNIEALPIWVNYLTVVVIAIVAVPSIIILIVKAIIAVFTSRDGSKSMNGTLPEYCKNTYELARRYNHWNLDGLEYNCAWISNVIAYIILLILYIWMLILEGFFSVDAIGNLVANTIGLIVVAALLFGALYLVLTYLAFIPSIIAARGKMTVYKSDLEKIKKIWAEVDPVKKAVLDRQKEEELRRWEEEQKRKEEISRVLRSGIIEKPTLSEKEIWGMSHEEWNKMNDDLDAVQSAIEQDYGPDFFKDV